MKRFHLHVAVSDLDQSIRFYETLFGVAPSVRKDDYAKWMLDDPRVNFAISMRAESTPQGVDHLGIQVDDVRELAAIDTRLKQAALSVRNQCDAHCCYARSDKAWSVDPAGLSWETFYTHGESITYGGDHAQREEAGACCTPARTEDKGETSCCS